MQSTGHGSTVITARAGIPLPKSTNSGRTIWDDIERAKKRRTGLDWPTESVVDTPRGPDPKPVLVRKPRKVTAKRPGPTKGHGPRAGSSIPQQDIERMTALYEGGMGLLAVGRATGYSKTTVVKYLRKAGVEIAPAGLNKIEWTPPPPRQCEYCGSDYALRDGERPSDFRRRLTCSRKCASSLAIATRKKESSHE